MNSPPTEQRQQFKIFMRLWGRTLKRELDWRVEKQALRSKGKLKRCLQRQMMAYTRRNMDKVRRFMREQVESARDPEHLLSLYRHIPGMMQTRTLSTGKSVIRNAMLEADLVATHCKRQVKTQAREMGEMMWHMAELEWRLAQNMGVRQLATPMQHMEDAIEDMLVREERGTAAPKEAMEFLLENTEKECRKALLRKDTQLFKGWVDRCHKAGDTRATLLSDRFLKAQTEAHAVDIENRAMRTFERCTFLDLAGFGQVLLDTREVSDLGFSGKGSPLGRTLRRQPKDQTPSPAPTQPREPERQ
ncbi:protein ORF-S [Elephant endotheliotropic herpesvirus 3B]|nr:protein ORF-S [Elephant endotheliotropic herpesvirus 3B]